MNERDIELAKQATKYALKLNPEEDAYGNPLNRDKFQRDRDARFADLIRADERKHLEAELLKLKDGVAASSDYIQGRWDLIGEFQDVIRARGQA